MLNQETESPEGMLTGDIYYLAVGEIVEFLKSFPHTSMRYLGPNVKMYDERRTVLAYLRSVGAWPSAESSLISLGLGVGILDKRVDSLTLAQRSKLAAVRAIAARPRLLVIERPEAYLDYGALRWLVGKIRRFPGTVIFTTNDRGLARALLSKSVMLHDNPVVYEKAVGLALLNLARAPRYVFQQPAQDCRLLVSMKNCEFDHYDSIFIESLEIRKGDRIAVFGPRSEVGTLFAAILMDADHISGDLVFAEKLVIGKHGIQEINSIPADLNVMDYVRRATGAEHHDAVDALTTLGLTRVMHQTVVDSLDVAVKSRVLLACIMLRRPPLIVMDNPTKYLTSDEIYTLCTFVDDVNSAIVLTTVCSELIESCLFTVYDMLGGRLINKTKPGCYSCWNAKRPVGGYGH